MTVSKHSVLQGDDIHVAHSVSFGTYVDLDAYSIQEVDDGKLAFDEEFHKLYFMDDGASKKYPISNLGNSIIVVDPAGGGDYTLLSSALVSCDGSTDRVIILNGIIEESATISGINKAHVFGMPGSSLSITPYSNEPGVDLTGIHDATVWQNVSITVNGVSSTHGILFTGASNLTLKNIKAITAGTGSGFYAASAKNIIMEDCTGTQFEDPNQHGNSNDGDNAKSFGKQNSAGSDGSFVIGELGEATYDNEFVHGGGNPFGSSRLGQLQNREFFLDAETSSTDPTEALLVNSDGRIVLPNLCLWKFRVTALASDTVVTSRFAALEYIGAIRRTTSAANTAIVGSVTKTMDENYNFSGCSLAISSDTTNGALKINVVSGSESLTQWGIRVEALQVLGLSV